MIQIEDKTKCCGCSACYNICPVNAIEMDEDFEGFKYPNVNKSKCINCELCLSVCPIINNKLDDNYNRFAVALRVRDEEILMSSTSGGFITPLADFIFKQGGVLCAAAYDNYFNVLHTFCDSSYNEKKKKIRGSKYVQSELNDCFKRIKNLLNGNRIVCFVGTPCQVYGLKSFLKKHYDNLYTVDVVCHGTPSPKLWRKYLDYQKNKFKSNITEINFRNKTYGYHTGTMKISFENGKCHFGSARIDPMLKSFFSEISSRPSCYECSFKEKKRISDFTIFDCWHSKQLINNCKDDDKGFTNVIVQSKKGEQILSLIADKYDIYKIDIEDAIRLDGIMLENSAVPHKDRAFYYYKLEQHTLSEHIKEFIPIKKSDYIIENMKPFLYKMGILRIVRVLKDRL